MTLTIKKKDKRNKIKYSIIGIYCEVGSPIMQIMLSNKRTKEFNRHELEICELGILPNRKY